MDFIEIGNNPIAFTIGPFEVMWYGIMVALAIVAIIAISLFEARRVGISEEHVYSFGLWAVIGGILVSRLVHVIDKWEYYMDNPGQIIGFEGLTVYGAVIGVVLAVLIYTWVKKISFWQIGDIIAPGALVGQAIGRIGCFLNGCCYGLPTSLPWAVVFTHPRCYALLGVPVHPTQIYHLLWNLLAFAVIWLLRTRLKPQGSLFLSYLALYATGDLIIRFVRPGDPFLFGMQQAQFIGVVILVITLPWLVIRMRRARAAASISESSSAVTRSEQNQED